MFVKEGIMLGSLNDILPEPISPENEAVLLEFLKRKMAVSLDLAVELLRAAEDWMRRRKSYQSWRWLNRIVRKGIQLSHNQPQ